MTNHNQTGTGGPAGPEKSQAEKNPETADLSREIYEEAVRERDEYLDSLRRLQAEFDNYRKRVLRDSQQLQARYAAQTMEDILPVMDNFERALKAAVEHDEKTLGEGVAMVYNQLSDVLAKRGLCEIDADGQPFDPSQHEAVLCRPSQEHEEGTVLEVLERGYQVDDTVIRPAKVIVSEGKPGK
ncbi:MAG: nucleotide exchange factor GrpE [Thermoleophilia bacterium]